MTTTDTPDTDLDLIHDVTSHFGTIFTWDYEQRRTPLIKLYEKAKTSQWNVTTDLDWSIDVDPEKSASEMGVGTTSRFGALQGIEHSPLRNFGDKEWLQVSVEIQNSLLSQFMHGEQGALLCTARIVETVPWIDAKYYAATQVMDEARHVEVFARYLDEKLSGEYRINDNLRSLLDDILTDSRWDITYLGMQIMVEGLALAAFGMMHQITTEPLLKKILRYVMSDEARHVAFGVLSLQEYYAELSASEMRERQEFAFDVACRLQQRFMQAEVWERMAVHPVPRRPSSVVYRHSARGKRASRPSGATSSTGAKDTYSVANASDPIRCSARIGIFSSSTSTRTVMSTDSIGVSSEAPGGMT